MERIILNELRGIKMVDVGMYICSEAHFIYLTLFHLYHFVAAKPCSDDPESSELVFELIVSSTCCRCGVWWKRSISFMFNDVISKV